MLRIYDFGLFGLKILKIKNLTNRCISMYRYLLNSKKVIWISYYNLLKKLSKIKNSIITSHRHY